MIQNEFQMNPIEPSPKKNIFSKKWIVLLLFFIIIVVLAILIYFFFFTKNKSETFEEFENTISFFLKNENKYALFDENGNQLTDFLYDETKEFKSHTAIVKKDNQYGIIANNGKMMVDFGLYDDISFYSGRMYIARNQNGSFLIHETGKVLYDLKDFTTEYLISMTSIGILNDSTNYHIIDSNGKEIFSIPIEKNKDFEIDETNQFTVLFYNNKSYIINHDPFTLVGSLSSNSIYQMSYPFDGGILLKNSSTYKVVKDGKITDLDCDNVISVHNSTHYFTCEKNSKKYLIDSEENFQKTIQIQQTTSFSDSKNYMESNENNSVDFSFNDETKTLKCYIPASDLYQVSRIYRLKNHCLSDKYEYFNEKGEKIISKSFESATDFDINHRAIVSEKKYKYYLIDENGKKLSEEYDDMYLSNEGYTVSKDNKKGLIDTNGKIIIPCEYSNIYTSNSIAILTKKNGEYVLYDIENQKEISSSTSKPVEYKGYIKVSIPKEKKEVYYTFSGKKILEKNI